jgi:hypothetical protein
MRSAELHRQLVCTAGGKRRSVRIDDDEPRRDAGVEPGRANARPTAGSGELVAVQGLSHVVWIDDSSEDRSSGPFEKARRQNAIALRLAHSAGSLPRDQLR